jgi:pimeloyl-ACP methyl ester carboxylesterase
VVVRISSVTADSWRALAERFEALLSENKVRQASFVGVAAGATIVQDLALAAPKLVRTLVIIDASLRPHPTRFERFLDRVEASLPFGLPLRLGSQGFNVRAYAHRLRCPMLLVSTSRASRFVSNELHALGSVAPTAWYVDLRISDATSEAKELASYVLAFQDTPAKCPQKNLQEAV